MSYVEMSIDEIINKLHDAIYRFERDVSYLFPGNFKPFPVKEAYAQMLKFCEPKNDWGWGFWYAPILKNEIAKNEKLKKTAHKRMRVALKHLDYMNTVIMNARDEDRFEHTILKWSGKPFKKRFTSTKPDRNVYPGGLTNSS